MFSSFKDETAEDPRYDPYNDYKMLEYKLKTSKGHDFDDYWQSINREGANSGNVVKYWNCNMTYNTESKKDAEDMDEKTKKALEIANRNRKKAQENATHIIQNISSEENLQDMLDTMINNSPDIIKQKSNIRDDGEER